MGDRFVVIMLGVLIVLGQTIFTYGVLQKSFMIMYLGRIVLGWGIESMLPTLTSFISPYYLEDYLVHTFLLHFLKGILCRVEPTLRAYGSGPLYALLSPDCHHLWTQHSNGSRHLP